MSVADLMAVLGPVGGAGGIAAAFKWYFDRAERLRKEQVELEERRRQEDRQDAQQRLVFERETAERLGRTLAETAAAMQRTGETLSSLDERVTEGFARVTEGFARVDQRFSTIEAHISRPPVAPPATHAEGASR